MKNKLKNMSIRLGAILLSSIMAFTSVSVYADDKDKGDSLVSQVERSDEDFSSYKYVKYNEADFDKIVDGLEDYVDTDTDKVLETIIGMEDFANNVLASYSLANIQTSLNVNDDEADEKLKYTKELYTNIVDKIQIAYSTIAHSKNSEVLRERIDDDEDWQDILDYVPMTDEQKEINKRITELELKYDELYNEKSTCRIDKKEYNEDELNDAYDNGDVGIMDYFAGLAEITKKRNETLGNLYLEMVSLRNQFARSYGYDNYAVYAYDKVYGRRYTPEDLEDFRDSVKEYYSPLFQTTLEVYQSDMADAMEEVCKVKYTSEDCLKLLNEHLDEVDPALSEAYDYMISHNLYDIDEDDQKTEGAFTTTISGKYNTPYLFNSATGDFSDVCTVIHEFGHYTAFYFADHDTYYYDTSDLDICEMHSQGLELVYSKYYDKMFGDYSDEINFYNTFNEVYGIVEGAKEDEFQVAVYEMGDDLTLSKLNKLYYDMSDEYQDIGAYNSYYLGMYGYLNSDEIYEWIEIPHTFSSPLYYVSYAISAAALEELRDLMLEDEEAGMEAYRKLLISGPSADFDDTLNELGINNPIDNPRCDVYASNMYDLLGLDNPIELSESDDYYDDEDEDEVEDSASDKKDKDNKDKDKKDKDKDKDAGWLPDSSAGIVILLVLGLFAIVLIVIIVLIIVVSQSNKKKQAAISQIQVVPSAYGQQSYTQAQNMNQQVYTQPQNMNQQVYMQAQSMNQQVYTQAQSMNQQVYTQAESMNEPPYSQPHNTVRPQQASMFAGMDQMGNPEAQINNQQINNDYFDYGNGNNQDNL